MNEDNYVLTKDELLLIQTYIDTALIDTALLDNDLFNNGQSFMILKKTAEKVYQKIAKLNEMAKQIKEKQNAQ